MGCRSPRPGAPTLSATDARRAESGFTLIEVLVAMIILAVGLLGLEALGIAAARANAQAQHRTALASRATQALEDAVRQVRTAAVITPQAQQCQTDLEASIEVCTAVVTAGLPPGAARIDVDVQRTVGNPYPYALRSYVYR